MTISTISNGHWTNLNGDGLAPCLNDGTPLSYSKVTGPSGKVYYIPYCPVDNPVPDLSTLSQIYGVPEADL